MSWKHQKKIRGSKKKRKKKRLKQQSRKAYKYHNAMIRYDRKERLGRPEEAVNNQP